MFWEPPWCNNGDLSSLNLTVQSVYQLRWFISSPGPKHKMKIINQEVMGELWLHSINETVISSHTSRRRLTQQHKVYLLKRPSWRWSVGFDFPRFFTHSPPHQTPAANEVSAGGFSCFCSTSHSCTRDTGSIQQPRCMDWSTGQLTHWLKYKYISLKRHI